MSTSQNITYVGLDAHAKSIQVAVIPPGSTKVDEEWQIAHEDRAIQRLVKRLLAKAKGEVHAAYEAGPCGYALQRMLEQLGIQCAVIAPSRTPIKPGDRVKTDRLDARRLATLHKGGLLTEVQPPTEADEALRDLTRGREDAKEDLMRQRHRISKMMLRHGLHFDETKNWTKKHHAWLRRLRFPERAAQATLDSYLLALDQVEARVAALDAAIKKEAEEGPRAEEVGWLRCFRGIDTVAAMTILSELHEVERFRSPRDLMAYLGLTPSETSSGGSIRRGPITKTGNTHLRRMVIQTAWSYRHRPAVSQEMRQRREGQPGEIIALADRAQKRLHDRYVHLKEDSLKPHNVVIVAIARELVGWLWATLLWGSRRRAA